MHINRQSDVLKAQPGQRKKDGQPCARRHNADPNLYLLVSADGRNRRWIYRGINPTTGKPTELGLGSAELVSLDDARDKARDYRKAIARGDDPIELKRKARRKGRTFGNVAEAFIAWKLPGWRSEKHLENTRRLLTNHASPLANKPIGTITPDDVEKTLRPVFNSSVDQGKRTLSAIRQVFEYAEDRDICTSNPAKKVRSRFRHYRAVVKNFTAMHCKDMPHFVRQLHDEQQSTEAMSPWVIEFLVLVACRLTEVTQMRWSEINLDSKVWTIPAERKMKSDGDHKVPLSDRAVALLQRQFLISGGGEYVWSRDGRRPLASKTVYIHLTRRMGLKVTLHGFRSTFCDWAGDETDFADETIEFCLAHVAGDTTKKAYRRRTALEKRRELMQAWADYLAT